MNTSRKAKSQKKSSEFATADTGGYVLRDAPGGLVESYVHPPGGTPALLGSSELIRIVEAGLPVRELERLQTSLGVSMERLAPKLGMSKATFHRRKLSGRLGREESDRVVRFARLLGKAVEVLEGAEPARRWLSSPQVGLGGAAPLDYAETEVGAREVEDLLSRIEYGVYS